jgi:hypothetical protein
MSQGIDMDAVIAELQKPDGWCKNDYGPFALSEGAVCLIGAMARVAGDFPASVEWRVNYGEIPLLKIMHEQFPERMSECSHVADFNDDPATTLDDVLLVCEKARAEQ